MRLHLIRSAFSSHYAPFHCIIIAFYIIRKVFTVYFNYPHQLSTQHHHPHSMHLHNKTTKIVIVSKFFKLSLPRLSSPASQPAKVWQYCFPRGKSFFSHFHFSTRRFPMSFYAFHNALSCSPYFGIRK